MSIRGGLKTIGVLATGFGLAVSGVTIVNGLSMGDQVPDHVAKQVTTSNMEETVRLVDNAETAKTLQETFTAINKGETITADQAKALAAHSFNTGTGVSGVGTISLVGGLGLLAATRRREPKKPSYSVK